MSELQTYPAHPRYRLYVGLGVLVAGLFAWELVQEVSPEHLFFFVVALGFGLVNLRWMLARVHLTAGGVSLYAPGTSRRVDFRQMVDVFEAGRGLQALTVVYYPLDQDGLLDLEQPRSLFLPAIAGQSELAGILRQRMPA